MIAAGLHGFVLALALILPLGPQNVWVLTEGARAARWRDTWVVLSTAAGCDTALIVLAVAGVAGVAALVPAVRWALTVAGVVFLVWVGARSWQSGAGAQDVRQPQGWGAKVRYTLQVSLVNPHALLDTVVIIGGGAALYPNPAQRWAYAGAASLVSWLWFVMVSAGGRWGAHITRRPGAAVWVGRTSAVLLWAIAFRTLWALWLT